MAAELGGVRSEDAFDVGAVHQWLLQNSDTPADKPLVQQFNSGASNLTYLLSYKERQLILRRPPVGTKAASAHDMKREFFIQKTLHPQFPITPQVIALCEDQSIIGSDFYVMQKIDGVIFRRELPSGISLTEQEITLIGDLVINGLVSLHHVDAAPLAQLSKGPGYVGRQVEGWSRRYRNALTSDVPDAEILMKWLDQNQPPDVASCVIHGDWRLDNLVFNLDKTPLLVGALDWELATIGDPLMDLGSSMAYWIDHSDEEAFANLRRQPSHLPGMPTRKEFIESYLAKSEWGCADFTFYEVFGLFRLTVILQQIWARYVAGETTNPSFAAFGEAVNLMVNRAMRMI